MRGVVPANRLQASVHGTNTSCARTKLGPPAWRAFSFPFMLVMESTLPHTPEYLTLLHQFSLMLRRMASTFFEHKSFGS